MKIICPHCSEIYEVDDGALSTTCPSCNKELDMEQAKQYTAQAYKDFQNAAYNDLYVTLDFESAYSNYLNCLMLKENDLTAIIGLCLTKTSMSKFDKTYFDQVEKIIDQYEVYLNLENTFLFLNFIMDMLDQINFYYTEVNSKCKKDDVFINKMYFDEYVKATNDINNLLKYFEDSFEIMDEKEYKQFVKEHENFLPRFEGRKTDVHNRLNSVYSVNHFGDIEVKDGESTILSTNKVDFDVEELENSSMVVKNEKGMKIKVICLPIVVLLAIISLILFIVFFVTKNNVLAYVASGSIVVTAVVFIIYQVLFRKTLK